VEALELSKKLVSIAIVLTLISTYLTLYTVMAHTVAMRHIVEDEEKVCWRTSAIGSLFPWPKEPGGNAIYLPVLIPINKVDLFIYRYLIKSWVLAGLSIIMWIVTGLSVLRVVKPRPGLPKEPPPNKNS